jgi:K+-sensing histidine kinase KdpD
MANNTADINQSSLKRKMETVFKAILEIQKTGNEEDACLVTLFSLESLDYPFAMISLLTEINGCRYVVANEKLSIGKKWGNIATLTEHRNYDNPTDILPLVLNRKQPRFILDSQNDPLNECDQELCRKMDVTTQYILPLATESLVIGTLQIDMGNLTSMPEDECIMLEALASHLSVSIERHRTLCELSQAQNELMNKSKLIAYDIATAKIMHSLTHEMKNYIIELNKAINDEEIRCNKKAIEFLKGTNSFFKIWFDSIKSNTLTLRVDEESEVVDPFIIIQEVISMWRQIALTYKCKFEVVNETKGASIYARKGSIKEVFSCLIMNSIEANARRIKININKSILENEEYVQFIISDDGDGIPEQYKEKIFTLGWTSKQKEGHGIGMTVIMLLTKEMGGFFEIESYGKSSQQEETIMRILIPIHSQI